MDIKSNFLDNHNVQDVAGLDQLRQAALSKDKGALEQAAKQFESIFMQMLIKSMRDVNAVFETDSPMNSRYAKFYQDMHDQQMSMEMSQNGSLGLADLIVEQLGGGDGNYKLAAHMRPGSQQFRHADYDKTPGNVDNDASVTPQNAESVAPQILQFDSPESFVEQLLPMAEKVAAKLPINPITMLAQAALETGWGKKIMNKADGQSAFNLFGIKADSSWQGEAATVNTLEFEQGVAKQQKANFRAYGSYQESMQDYVDFIGSNARYQQALNAQTPEQYTEEIQAAGYATDPDYAKKIMSILDMDVFKQAQKLLSSGQLKGED